jgi:uncharacterized spore protein YtfJ
MTDEPNTQANLIAGVGEQLTQNLDTIFGEVDPAGIFNTLEHNDDRLVIGAATIERAGGFGFGAGEGVDSAGVPNGGGGGGGGGAGQARPVAVIELTKEGVRIWPVIDYTKLGLVAVGVLAAIWKARR